jgi:hypothetical protein
VSDEDLRALERAVAQTGSPGARLRWARELERLGQRDDVLAALAPGWRDAEVRRELARFPVWGRDQASRFGTRFIDARVIEGKPRLRWRTTQSGRARYPMVSHLLASPLGVVGAFSGARQEQKVVVLEPDSGTERHSWTRIISDGDLSIEGGHVLDPRWIGVFAIDLATGERRELLPRGERVTASAAVARTMIAVEPMRADFGSEVCVYHFEPSGPSCREAWRVQRAHTAYAVTATRELVLERRPPGGFTARDRRDGREVWSSGGQLTAADERSVFAYGGGELFELGPDGSSLWWVAIAPRARAVAFAPGFVLVATPAPGEPEPSPMSDDEDAFLRVTFTRIHRTNGAASSFPGTFVNGGLLSGMGAIGVVRDGVYVVSLLETVDATPGRAARYRSELACLTHEGEVRWRFPLEGENGMVLALAPLDRGLHVLTSTGSVLCLEENPSAQ